MQISIEAAVCVHCNMKLFGVFIALYTQQWEGGGDEIHKVKCKRGRGRKRKIYTYKNEAKYERVEKLNKKIF